MKSKSVKSKFLLLGTVFIMIFLLNACKEESTTGNENPPPAGSDYFPNGDGNYYKYALERTDSNGTTSTGTRSSRYSGTSIIGGTNFQVQLDSINVSGLITVSTSYFWKSQTGVFYFIDTTGLAEFLPSDLPVQINIDSLLRFFTLPLNSVSSWPVFVLSASLGTLFNLKVIEITGAYQGEEQVALNLNSGMETINAAKVKFELVLNIPDDPANPLIYTSRKYEAFCWLGDNIGPIKWEGNGTILNLFGGGGIDLADTTTVFSQSLVEYDVK